METHKCPTCGLQTIDGYCRRCGDRDDPLYGDVLDENVDVCPTCGEVDCLEHKETDETQS